MLQKYDANGIHSKFWQGLPGFRNLEDLYMGHRPHENHPTAATGPNTMQGSIKKARF